MAIHQSAIINPRAEIGKNNEIGPHVIIEGPVQIGDGNIIEAGVVLKNRTCIGNNNHIHPHAVIGNDPQDVTFKGGNTRTIIGDGNIIREFVTIHRATREEGATKIGDNNFIMVSAHIAHDCIIGDSNYIVNYVALAGHVTIGDHVFISSYSGVHQFTRVGSYAMVGGLTGVNKDVPPFMIANGQRAVVLGINMVGLKRNGFSPDRRVLLKRAYVQLYRRGTSLPNSLIELGKMMEASETLEQRNDLQMLIEFIRSSKRGIILKSPKDEEEHIAELLL